MRRSITLYTGPVLLVAIYSCLPEPSSLATEYVQKLRPTVSVTQKNYPSRYHERPAVTYTYQYSPSPVQLPPSTAKTFTLEGDPASSITQCPADPVKALDNILRGVTNIPSLICGYSEKADALHKTLVDDYMKHLFNNHAEVFTTAEVKELLSSEIMKVDTKVTNSISAHEKVWKDEMDERMTQFVDKVTEQLADRLAARIKKIDPENKITVEIYKK